MNRSKRVIAALAAAFVATLAGLAIASAPASAKLPPVGGEFCSDHEATLGVVDGYLCVKLESDGGQRPRWHPICPPSPTAIPTVRPTVIRPTVTPSATVALPRILETTHTFTRLVPCATPPASPPASPSATRSAIAVPINTTTEGASLPVTGRDLRPLIIGGIGLIAFGAASVIFTVRRRRIRFES